MCVYASLGSRVCLRSSLVPCLSRLPCPVPPFSSFSPLSPFSSFSSLSPFFLPSNGHNVCLSEGEERPKGSRSRVISRTRGASSASHGVKSHFPRSWRDLRHPGSDSRSRSPLSIRALRSARDPREGRRTTFGSIYRFKIYRSGLASARLVQDDGSRKLPQNIRAVLGPLLGSYFDGKKLPSGIMYMFRGTPGNGKGALPAPPPPVSSAPFASSSLLRSPFRLNNNNIRDRPYSPIPARYHRP